MTDNPTICTKCKHLDKRGEVFADSPHLWHCLKAPQTEFSYVLNEEIQRGYEWAHSINTDGNCPDFEAADD